MDELIDLFLRQAVPLVGTTSLRFVYLTEGDAWVVDLYLPFRGTYDTMAERDFIALPRASALDVRSRASQIDGA